MKQNTFMSILALVAIAFLTACGSDESFKATCPFPKAVTIQNLKSPSIMAKRSNSERISRLFDSPNCVSLLMVKYNPRGQVPTNLQTFSFTT